MAHNQVAQVFFALQVGALQKLAQLPNLHLGVNALEPLAHALQDSGFRAVYVLLQFIIDFVFTVVDPRVTRE